jgi:hypothetical protein
VKTKAGLLDKEIKLSGQYAIASIIIIEQEDKYV